MRYGRVRGEVCPEFDPTILRPPDARRRDAEESIFGGADHRPASGADVVGRVQEICRREGVSRKTFYRWRRKYGRLNPAGRAGKRVVTARERRGVVAVIRQAAGISERRPIRWTGFSRFSMRYRSVREGGGEDELRGPWPWRPRPSRFDGATDASTSCSGGTGG